MTKTQFWITSVLAAMSLLLVGGNTVLAAMNRSLQGDIALRQQYVQQSVQLEGLYREIVRALAELGARHNDEEVRTLLARHGITYTAAPPQPAAAGAAPRKEGR